MSFRDELLERAAKRGTQDVNDATRTSNPASARARACSSAHVPIVGLVGLGK